MKSFQSRFLTVVYSGCIALLMSVLIMACDDKDDDNQPPVIDLQVPSEFDQYRSIDTIPILAYISDNKQLESVTIDIETLDFEPVTARRQYGLSGSSITFVRDLFLEEPFLESGTYYLVMRASDGSNVTSVFIQIYLVATEREIEQFVVTTNTGNSTKVLTSENLAEWTERLDLFVDASGSALNYRQGLIGISGGEIGNTDFYETEDYELTNSIPGFGTPSIPYFFGLEFDAAMQQFYVYRNEPDMQVLDENASGLYNVPLQTGFLPEQSFRLQGVNYVEQENITNSNRIIGAYSVAGLLFTSYAIDGDAKLLSEKSSNELFLWENTPEGTQLSVINTSNDLFVPVYNRFGEALLAAVELESGVFMISTEAGLYRYNYNNGGTTPLASSPTPTDFLYDDLDGLIYASQGNTLYVLSVTGQVANTVQFDAPILDFAIDYNR